MRNYFCVPFCVPGDEGATGLVFSATVEDIIVYLIFEEGGGY